MAQKLLLHLPNESPFFCLRTGEMLISGEADLEQFGKNNALCYLFVIDEVYIRDDFEKARDSFEEENPDDADFLESLNDDYIVIDFYDHEGSMSVSGTMVLNYPKL